jgi:hypothetical protein
MEFLQGWGKALVKRKVNSGKEEGKIQKLPDPPKPCRTIKEKFVRFVNEKSALSGSNGRVPTLVNMPFSCGQLIKLLI